MKTTSFPPSPALNVVDKLGGIVCAASLLGRHRTSVNRWLKSGLIPADVQRDIIALTREGRASVTPEDFFRLPDSAEAA